MFCGNCGSKAIEGNLFCVTCGQAQHSDSASESAAGPALEEPETPAEESNLAEAVSSAAPVDRTVPVKQPGEQSLFCRHSPSERTTLGVDTTDGSEICRGCKLSYAPGSPGSGLRPAVSPTVPTSVLGKRPLYCRHSLSERTLLGVDMKDGSETCRGCRLLYAPGSPKSHLHSPTGRTAALPTNTGLARPSSSGTTPTLFRVWMPVAALALALIVVIALAFGGSQGNSGGTAKDVDYTSASSIAKAIDAGGFTCTAWTPNPQAIMVRESGSCTHGSTDITVSTYNDANQMQQFDKLLKDSGLASGVIVEGDQWQVNANDKDQATAVQKIVGGTVK